jgi:hypothetical protein
MQPMMTFEEDYDNEFLQYAKYVKRKGMKEICVKNITTHLQPMNCASI